MEQNRQETLRIAPISFAGQFPAIPRRWSHSLVTFACVAWVVDLGGSIGNTRYWHWYGGVMLIAGR